ncbi:hypothetical protein MAPG_05946 [Magnaporthiopsis poae ATCC 64411]|uniref:Uncharacterized protein n=1 Tax=Magnaporthiopsis poae (strain ATCC 64411 / 73-15) TaxID=644358 RepID=A0A0C4E0R3_MAGP6|nr:hypothetical protein MAPG_05946 [Magnaporthiopsis poae ATCC 64411]
MRFPTILAGLLSAITTHATVMPGSDSLVQGRSEPAGPGLLAARKSRWGGTYSCRGPSAYFRETPGATA